jgi:hypothetical protein
MQKKSHDLYNEFINFVLLHYFSVFLFVKLMKGASNGRSVNSFSMKICRILQGEAARVVG